MDYAEISVQQVEATATVSLNRPDALNAITPTMLAELKQAIDEAGADASVRAIVLTGAGRAFSAGVDLKALGARSLDKGCVGPILDDPARALIDSIRSVPKPVIAKVNGFCFTGALELALACDLFFVAQEAKLGDTHAKWGLRPTWGMSQRLPAAVGLARAKELSFTARTFTGADAEALGMANRAVPRDELNAAVDTVIAEMSENSADSIAAYKVLYNQGAAEPVNQGVIFEAEHVFDISDTNELLKEFLS